MTASLPPLIERFFTFLADEKGAALNTIKSYSYAFQLLLAFACTKLGKKPDGLELQDLSLDLIEAFLAHLETNRGNQPSSRNQRRAALRSFFVFLQFRMPSALAQISQVLAIPRKKAVSRLVNYLDRQQTQALVQQPSADTPHGCRDRVMLLLGCHAGLRASEIVGLKLEDVALDNDASILVTGKGRRQRRLPLNKAMTLALRKWLARRPNVSSREVFLNARGQPLTRSGLAYIVKSHAKAAAETCPSLRDKPVHPHVLRHTCAMAVLQSSHDIRQVALWLGHSRVETAEVYLRVDPMEKLRIDRPSFTPSLKPGRWTNPGEIMARLKSLSLCGAAVRPPERLLPSGDSSSA